VDSREANRRSLAAYEGETAAYLRDRAPAPSDDLVRLYDAVATAAPGGSVLEIGSGPGTCADELERRGLRVRRTDATVAFVERLRTLGHEADVLDALTDDLGGPYDILYANAVLLHFGRSDLAELLQRATKAVQWLACTVKEGDGEAWTTRKLSTPRWFVYWREPELRELLSGSGWRVEWISASSGRFDRWLTVFAERA
jgi:trans-aconitate methyltransferase